MTDEDWQAGFAKSLGVYLNGDTISSTDSQGLQIVDDTFYLLFNAHHEALPFRIPSKDWGKEWVIEFDTNDPAIGEGAEPPSKLCGGGTVTLAGRSMLLLRRAT